MGFGPSDLRRKGNGCQRVGEGQLHRLRHGQEKKVLRELAAFPKRGGEAGSIIEREKNYFAAQARRMNYHQLPNAAGPLAVGRRIACRQRQCRRKRPDNFGRDQVYDTWMLWKKHVTTVNGMIFG